MQAALTRRWAGRISLALAGLAGLALAGAAWPAPAEDHFTHKLLQLGTGSQGGAFRPIGAALCDAVNEDRRRTLVRCIPAGTAGSTYNLQAVASGALDLGLAQEDLVAAFVRNAGDGASQRLRVVAIMHTSPIAVMAHADAGMQSLEQVAGKRVNLGNRGSGQFTVTEAILKALGMTPAALGAVRHFPTDEFEARFCAREVDVVVEALAHPAEVFRKLAACGGRLLDLPDTVRESMRRDNPWLRDMTIPAGTYQGQDRDIRTLGMRNILVTSSAVSDEAIYRFTTSLGARLDLARAGEPMLRSVEPLAATAAAPSLPAPLHEGARRALTTRTSR